MMTTLAKRVVLVAVLLIFFAVVPHALAQTQTGFVPLAPIPGLTQGVTADTAGLATFFNNLYKYLIGLAATLAVIMIIWGGLEYSTQDSISKKSAGKQRIYNALFGLVLVLSPYLVFSIINPGILNLSINLDKLEAPSGATTTPSLGLCPPGTTTNCIPRPERTGGYSQSEYPSWWCFAIRPYFETIANRNLQFNYLCAETRFYCEMSRKGYSAADVRGTCAPVGTPLDPGTTIERNQCPALGEVVNTSYTCAGAPADVRRDKPFCWDLRGGENGICVW